MEEGLYHKLGSSEVPPDMSVHHCITALRKSRSVDLPLLPKGLVLPKTEEKDLGEAEASSSTDVCW